MSLAKIGECIDQNKPHEFIKVYLICLAQGFSMSCPTEKDHIKLNEKWSKILPKYRQNFSDEFCHIVSTQWGQLLQQCDPTSNQLELDLLTLAGISPETVVADTAKPIKTTREDIPTPRDNSSDPLTTPEISPSYRQRQMAENVTLPDVGRLNAIYKKFFKEKDPDQFLIGHLTFAKYGQPKHVPKSSVPQQIRESWESIIANEFNTIAEDEFLVSITNEWFYLVNQKGIPLTEEDQSDILVAFLAKKNRPEMNINEKKSPSLFQKFFGSK